MAELPKKITDDPYGAAVLIRRLVMEQAIVYWRRYLTAIVLMGIAAAATSISAYILGEAINKAYVDKNIPGIALFSGLIVVLFIILSVVAFGIYSFMRTVRGGEDGTETTSSTVNDTEPEVWEGQR